jgi:hypothetical protein
MKQIITQSELKQLEAIALARLHRQFAERLARHRGESINTPHTNKGEQNNASTIT